MGAPTAKRRKAASGIDESVDVRAITKLLHEAYLRGGKEEANRAAMHLLVGAKSWEVRAVKEEFQKMAGSRSRPRR